MLVVDRAPADPALNESVGDRASQRACQQPKVVVRDIEQRVAVQRFHLTQLLECRQKVLEFRAVFLNEALQLRHVASIELYEVSAPQSSEDQLEIARAHGQKRQQRESCAKVYRDETILGFPGRAGTSQHVRLALHCPPLVLPGEFRRAHVMEEFHKLGHEDTFLKVLSGFARRGVVGLAAAKQLIVGLEPPDTSVDPLVDLAVRAQRVVVECRVRIDDGPLAAEPYFGSSTHELLPEDADPCGGLVHLG